MISKRMKAAWIAGIALVLVAAGGVAYASIPAPDGTINGCRKNTDGTLRVIDSTSSCPAGFTPLNWKQNGVSDYHVYQQSFEVTNMSGMQAVDVYCADFASGQRALGGGVSSPGQDMSSIWLVQDSAPIASENGFTDGAIGWHGQVYLIGSPSSVVASVTSYVVCAKF